MFFPRGGSARDRLAARSATLIAKDESVVPKEALDGGPLAEGSPALLKRKMENRESHPVRGQAELIRR